MRGMSLPSLWFFIFSRKAPEAANILWENLELSKKERAHRKTLTLWVTIALLGASFAFLYASDIAEREHHADGEAFFIDKYSLV